MSGLIAVFPSSANDKSDANEKNIGLSTAYATTSNKRLLENLMKQRKPILFEKIEFKNQNMLKLMKFYGTYVLLGIRRKKQPK